MKAICEANKLAMVSGMVKANCMCYSIADGASEEGVAQEEVGRLAAAGMPRIPATHSSANRFSGNMTPLLGRERMHWKIIFEVPNIFNYCFSVCRTSPR